MPLLACCRRLFLVVLLVAAAASSLPTATAATTNTTTTTTTTAGQIPQFALMMGTSSALLNQSVSMVDFVHAHGYVRLAASPALVREVQSLTEAAAPLFAQPMAQKLAVEADMQRRIEASVAAEQLQAANHSMPRELQLWCVGLRTNGCTVQSGQHRREQFHAVCDPRALSVCPWPEAATASAGASPASWDRMRSAVESVCSSEMAALSTSLLYALAPDLHDVRVVDIRERGDPSVLDVLFYDQQPATAAPPTVHDGDKGHDVYGMGTHVDPGLLSCKYVNAVGGGVRHLVDDRSGTGRGGISSSGWTQQLAYGRLEVQDRVSGMWVEESAFEGSVLCFVNQMLADWTVAHSSSDGGSENGSRELLLTATPHRVVMPAPPSADADDCSGWNGENACRVGGHSRLSVVYELRAPARELW